MVLGGPSQNLDPCSSHDRGTERGRWEREEGGDVVRAECAGEQKFRDVGIPVISFFA
jgi:hypothetical protein